MKPDKNIKRMRGKFDNLPDKQSASNLTRKRIQACTKQEKEYLLTGFQKLWIPVYGAAANYIFFRAGAGLYEQLRIRGILIRDCSNYKGLGAGYYRVAVRTHEENERLMKALREVYPEGLTGGSHTSGSARREMEER